MSKTGTNIKWLAAEHEMKTKVTISCYMQNDEKHLLKLLCTHRKCEKFGWMGICKACYNWFESLFFCFFYVLCSKNSNWA